MCQRSFKTHHRLMVHMGVHRGEKFPCGKCGKVLATKRTWTEHTKACVSGIWVECPDCGQEYSCNQGMHQHQRAKHGVEAPAQVRGGYICPFCGKGYQIKKTWVEHKLVSVTHFYSALGGTLSSYRVSLYNSQCSSGQYLTVSCQYEREPPSPRSLPGEHTGPQSTSGTDPLFPTAFSAAIHTHSHMLTVIEVMFRRSTHVLLCAPII